MNKITKGKILGKGMFGQTYLVKHEEKEYALKIQKVLEKDMLKKSMKINLWGEIDFYTFINNLSEYDQSYFMKM